MNPSSRDQPISNRMRSAWRTLRIGQRIGSTGAGLDWILTGGIGFLYALENRLMREVFKGLDGKVEILQI